MAEPLNTEEIAALRLRLNDPAKDPDAFIAEATWHGLFRRRLLAHKPYGALVTESGKAALNAVDEGQPDA